MKLDSWRSLLLAVVLVALVAFAFLQPSTASEAAEASAAEAFDWDLPAGFPVPLVPQNNPITQLKVDLGRHLFFDNRLSVNGTFACASCHQPELAFTDGLEQAIGVTGQQHPRSALSLANVAYSVTLTWADPELDRLEVQMLTPMFSEHPVELGLAGMKQEVLSRLSHEPSYDALFRQAFPDDSDPINLENLVRAIASFERTLISGSSPYDRYVYWGETEEFPKQARAGMRLFFSDRFKCSVCHSGFAFSGPVHYVDGPPTHADFHNTGLYNIEGTGAYSPGNQGLVEYTSNSEDMGHFRAPTLRNIAITAPYTHDGSVRTLGEMIAHYSNGGRSLRVGTLTEIGRDNPYKSEEIGGFEMTSAELEELIAFLDSLTDWDFLNDPRFQDPGLTH